MNVSSTNNNNNNIPSIQRIDFIMTYFVALPFEDLGPTSLHLASSDWNICCQICCQKMIKKESWWRMKFFFNFNFPQNVHHTLCFCEKQRRGLCRWWRQLKTSARVRGGGGCGGFHSPKHKVSLCRSPHKSSRNRRSSS